MGQILTKEHAMTKTLALAALSLSTALVAASGASASTVVYREIFPVDSNAPAAGSTINPTGAVTVDQLVRQGWYGGNSGDQFQTVGNNTDASLQTVGGEGAIGLGAPFAADMLAVNSNPIGPTTGTAYAFTSQNSKSNLFLYTTEFSRPSSQITEVRWDSRNNVNSVTNPTASTKTTDGDKWYDQGKLEAVDSHVAIRIDTGATKYWYISQQGFLHQGSNQVWSTNVAQIALLDWYAFNQGPSDGSLLPNTTFSSLLDVLPSGTIDAIGIFMSRSGGNVRIDNFSVAAVPLPGPIVAMLTAVMGFGLFARARRRTAA
jgi:hypothetical protein